MPNFLKQGKKFVSHKSIIGTRNSPEEKPKKEIKLPPVALAPEARAALEAEYIELFGKNPHPQIGDVKLQQHVDKKKKSLPVDDVKKDAPKKEGAEDTPSTNGENTGDDA